MPDAGPDGARDNNLDYGPLGQSLGFLLRLAQLRSFATFYKDMGALDIRPGEMTLLMVLAENPGVRQGILAKALRIKRAHMTKMVHGMEADGLIARTVPEGDKRSVELWLTEAGRARIDAVRPDFGRHEAKATGPLTQAEAAELRRLLRRYVGFDVPADAGCDGGGMR
ncbi:MarR family winged helix-turn-helix transcriptional regulator [Sagittula salina]|uniref:Winged helix-turn-helix transcriptional regulator n=1 Tax=Sagittula salina TaxID=2820268 RepID=A0A940MTP4_9RHOB|nr:MarR family winged helix-turn-helix transcriptional regulator [Sagittula salina]MBP0484867.1 winged helix-turn-helix transcriptional regulator [Sagittula salina]